MESLINRFKEFRRPPRDRSKVDSTTATPALRVLPQQKPPLQSLMETPPVPPGEDQASFRRHNHVLLAESKKARPNMQVVTSLMEVTYALRRKDIISSTADVKHHLIQYPFLQNVDQVRNHIL